MLVKDIIASERRKRGYSAVQLAEMIHVNKGTINRYENGTIKVIPVDVLKNLASIFGYSFDDFVSGDPKYNMLADHPTDSVSPIDNDDRLILRWYHNLPAKHQEFLREIASNSYLQ